jgi:exodeoxyribonuclease VII large subunit
MTSEQNHLFNKVYKESQKPKEEQVLSVGTYLSLLNIGLKKSGPRRIKGEISSMDIKNRYLFFNIKDKEDESMLNCFMWRRNYDLSGIDIEIGMEVIVSGYPEVYKPRGSFNLQAQTIELVGEGALKKAYDELKKKLEKEGLFLPERKKTIPNFPKRIGLVTSKDAAAYGDFIGNLSKFNFKVFLSNSSVEGKRAVPELLKALHSLKKKDIDVLVITRGGGSIESLQAFDNETLVREIADFPKPVISAIGHHKDIPLVALSADVNVSTPTAAAKEINRSWEEARHKVYEYEREIIALYNQNLFNTERKIFEFSNELRKKFKETLENFRRLESDIRSFLEKFKHTLKNIDETITSSGEMLTSSFHRLFNRAEEKISFAKESIFAFNPKRQLDLGYSIVSAGGRVIKSIKNIKTKDKIDVQVSDGIIEGEVIKTKKKNE